MGTLVRPLQACLRSPHTLDEADLESLEPLLFTARWVPVKFAAVGAVVPHLPHEVLGQSDRYDVTLRRRAAAGSCTVHDAAVAT